MIIDGICSEGDDFIFKVTDNTKKFIVSFFGFYPHSMSEDFHSFLETLEVEEVIGSSFDKSLMKCDFSLDGDFGYECYDCCDRRTFDVGIVLQKTFDTENEANQWFLEKVKNSDDIRKKDICEILIIDADKFIEYLYSLINDDDKYTTILDAFDEKILPITKAYNMAIMEIKEDLLLTFNSDSDKDTINTITNDSLIE
jgi:hypothetical protein